MGMFNSIMQWYQRKFGPHKHMGDWYFMPNGTPEEHRLRWLAMVREHQAETEERVYAGRSVRQQVQNSEAVILATLETDKFLKDSEARCGFPIRGLSQYDDDYGDGY